MKKLIFSLAVSFSIMSCDSSPKVIEVLENEQINSLIASDTAYKNIIADLNDLQVTFDEDPILRAKFSEYSYKEFLAYKQLFEDSLKVKQLSDFAALRKEHYLDSIHLVLKDTVDLLISSLKTKNPLDFVSINLSKYEYRETSYSRYSDKRWISEFYFNIRSDSNLLGIEFWYDLFKKNTQYSNLPIGDYFEIGKRDYLRVQDGIDKTDLSLYTLDHIRKNNKILGKSFTVRDYQSYYYGIEDEYSSLEFDIPYLYGDELSIKGFNSGDYKIEYTGLSVITENGNTYRFPTHHYKSLDSLGLEGGYTEDQYQYIFEDVFSIPSAGSVWFSAFNTKRLKMQKDYSELGFELEQLISSKKNDSRLDDLLRLLAD